MTTPTFTAAIRGLPDIIGELRTNTTPTRATTDERRPPGHHPNAPARLTTICDADTAYAILTENAHETARLIGGTPPRTPAHTNTRRTLGIPANTTPEAAYQHARTLARYIEHQLPLITDTTTVEIIEDDIITEYQRLTTKYPTKQPPEHINARCTSCHKLALHKHAPRSFGDDETFKCHACWRWHTEQEVVERRAARERELKHRPGRKRRTAAA